MCDVFQRIALSYFVDLRNLGHLNSKLRLTSVLLLLATSSMVAAMTLHIISERSDDAPCMSLSISSPLLKLGLSALVL